MKNKNCIICLKEINSYKENGGRGSRIISKRPNNSITCSRFCSKIYARVYDRVRHKLKRVQR